MIPFNNYNCSGSTLYQLPTFLFFKECSSPSNSMFKPPLHDDAAERVNGVFYGGFNLNGN